MRARSPQARLGQTAILLHRQEDLILSEERRRTRYDIYADIIEMIARKGLCSLTRVSYGANMPVDRTKRELKFLASHGFINEITLENSKKYRATKWGLEYLETFKRMRKFFAALEGQTT